MQHYSYFYQQYPYRIIYTQKFSARLKSSYFHRLKGLEKAWSTQALNNHLEFSCVMIFIHIIFRYYLYFFAIGKTKGKKIFIMVNRTFSVNRVDKWKEWENITPKKPRNKKQREKRNLVKYFRRKGQEREKAIKRN